MTIRLKSQMFFDSGPYPADGQWHSFEWTCPYNQIELRSIKLWNGCGYDFFGDVHIHVDIIHQNGWPADEKVAIMRLHRYGRPIYDPGINEIFDPPHLVNKNDILRVHYFASNNPGMQAHFNARMKWTG